MSKSTMVEAIDVLTDRLDRDEITYKGIRFVRTHHRASDGGPLSRRACRKMIQERLLASTPHGCDNCALHDGKYKPCGVVRAVWVGSDGVVGERVFWICEECLAAGNPEGPGYRRTTEC